MTVLRVVDIETTGFAPPQAEVIELGWQSVYRGESSWLLSSESRGFELYSSERPCPPEVLAVHHILDEERQHLARFSNEDLLFDRETIGVAHNAEFEQLFLGSMFREWICTYKAALRVWPEAPSHSNQSLMYWLGLHTIMDTERRQPPHRALPDAYVTAYILCRLLEETTLENLLAWTLEPRLLPTCPIGKFRGQRWPDVESGFLNWMLAQATMEADLKWNARRELDRRRTAHLAGA